MKTKMNSIFRGRVLPSQLQINKTKHIKFPNKYIQSLYNDFKEWAFDEESASHWRGQWRKSVFQTSKDSLLHLEIGPGTGNHFSQLCFNHPKEYFVAIELKYKPLIQTIIKTRTLDCYNGRMIRHNAKLLDCLFKKKELNNIYIHFPDPWPKTKHKKNRLITNDFVQKLKSVQKSNSLLEFKTDSRNYFLKSVAIFNNFGYEQIKYSENLYENQKINKKKLETLSQFELIFFQKQLPIYYALFNNS